MRMLGLGDSGLQGISRPVIAVQKQLRRMYPEDQNHDKGSFTPQESQRLAELYEVHREMNSLTRLAHLYPP